MAGHISGLQQRICDRNNTALFVNCDNHSLNLAGVHSAKQDPVVVTFFGTLENIYSLGIIIQQFVGKSYNEFFL